MSRTSSLANLCSGLVSPELCSDRVPAICRLTIKQCESLQKRIENGSAEECQHADIASVRFLLRLIVPLCDAAAAHALPYMCTGRDLFTISHFYAKWISRDAARAATLLKHVKLHLSRENAWDVILINAQLHSAYARMAHLTKTIATSWLTKDDSQLCRRLTAGLQPQDMRHVLQHLLVPMNHPDFLCLWSLWYAMLMVHQGIVDEREGDDQKTIVGFPNGIRLRAPAQYWLGEQSWIYRALQKQRHLEVLPSLQLSDHLLRGSSGASRTDGSVRLARAMMQYFSSNISPTNVLERLSAAFRHCVLFDSVSAETAVSTPLWFQFSDSTYRHARRGIVWHALRLMYEREWATRSVLAPHLLQDMICLALDFWQCDDDGGFLHARQCWKNCVKPWYALFAKKTYVPQREWMRNGFIADYLNRWHAIQTMQTTRLLDGNLHTSVERALAIEQESMWREGFEMLVSLCFPNKGNPFAALYSSHRGVDNLTEDVLMIYTGMMLPWKRTHAHAKTINYPWQCSLSGCTSVYRGKTSLPIPQESAWMRRWTRVWIGMLHSEPFLVEQLDDHIPSWMRDEICDVLDGGLGTTGHRLIANTDIQNLTGRTKQDWLDKFVDDAMICVDACRILEAVFEAP